MLTSPAAPDEAPLPLVASPLAFEAEAPDDTVTAPEIMPLLESNFTPSLLIPDIKSNLPPMPLDLPLCITVFPPEPFMLFPAQITVLTEPPHTQNEPAASVAEPTLMHASPPAPVCEVPLEAYTDPL
jgi:hypothetical protein